MEFAFISDQNTWSSWNSACLSCAYLSGYKGALQVHHNHHHHHHHHLHHLIHNHHHIHHHIHEGLGVFPVPWSSRYSWSLHLFLGLPTFLRPFGFYCSACFGSLLVSILCTCCSHFSWYCFISFTMALQVNSTKQYANLGWRSLTGING